ncbi:hypothetical protein AB0910_28040 [Streptomyces sp. NPDC047002]|uniref:hypothetical protein n=1 Tax=Streptomyces sp. NPDC047002 TaxID=3155475 RepID=UPI003454B840
MDGTVGEGPDGLLWSLFTPEGREDPHPALAELRRTAPVHFAAGLGVYFLTRYADCRAVLTGSAFAAPDPWTLSAR